MDAVISSVAGKAAEFTIAPIGRQLGYIRNYKGNLTTMKTDVEMLEGIKESVQHTVEEARSNGEEIEKIVLDWLNKVDNTVVEAKNLIDTEDHAKAHCSMGHFPNLFTRHQLSRKTKKMSQEISERVQAKEKFDRISYHVPAQVTLSQCARGYEALDSRTSMLNDIMLALKNPNIFIIGVFGMGGVGKTTLVKELAYQAEKNDSFFSVVAVATITRSPDLEKIQDEIAGALGMKFDKERKEERAMQLRKWISNKKSILVILDDIWGELDLTEVGIPFGEDHKGCKLVVTSRDLNLLNREMVLDKEFRLQVLLKDDSWKLFEKMAGDVVQDFNIKPIAIKVASRCAGLPLLIVTVATALRKKNIYDWQAKLIELESLDQEELHEKVHSTLKLSYNWLETEELKSLFSFIGSFGLDHMCTEDLFTFYWGLGLYRYSSSLTNARTRCYKLINDLKASSLLLESEPEMIRIHDVVREVAKSIASKTRPTYDVQRFAEKQFPEMDELQKYHQIIILSSYINKIPEKLDFSELKLLILHNRGDYVKVPDDFFFRMGELKVIVLRRMMLTPSPPPSLCFLTKIQSLDMSRCVLEDISIVAELKSLEILILEGSDIKELPKEIGQLTNLRMLNITNCCGLRFIPSNLISSLTCLEELYMGNCFINWDVKGSKDQRNNASLDELGNLSHLTALDIMIQDASVWPRELQVFEKLVRYNIFVGDKWKWPSLGCPGNAYESSRILKLEDNRSSNIFFNSGFNLLLNSAEDMCLAKIQCVRNVFYELNMKGFPQLKHLCIQDSSDLKYIIDSMALDDPVLPNLETLVLENLFNLEEICHGILPIQCFSKLKSFEVKGCDKLKNLLSYSHDRNLPELHKIKISDCKMITEIIAVQTSEADKDIDNIMFPKLVSLELEHLPSLISFCSIPLKADNQCMPVALINQKVVMPHLELLKLSKIKSSKLWDDNLPGCSFIQNLKSLTIDECDNIVYAFSSSVVRELVNLRHLAISNCQMLEEIFVSDGKFDPLSLKPFSNDEVVFPNLETLEISHMEQLKSLWNNQSSPNSFCKLKQLKIESCNKLSNVFPSYVLDKLQNLEIVTVTCCHALEVVFETQGLKEDGGRQTKLEMKLGTLTLYHLPMLKDIWSGNPNKILKFQNLCQLKVTKCENLNHVFPLSMAKEIQHLQELYIEKCGVEIIVAQDETVDTDPLLIFPELTSLSLVGLTKLRSFYSGSLKLDCPVLSHVDVLHCDEFVLFKPKSQNYQDIVPVDTLPRLSFEKVVRNTRELILNSKDVAMLCNGQLNDEHIDKVSDLCLRCFHDESDKFPSGFLQRFINLKNLKVTGSSFTYIFSSGSDCAGHSETTIKLRSLELTLLDNLEFICKEKSELHPVIQNIETLIVNRCSRLKNIGLFENLEQLRLTYCAGLEILMKSSTASSLQKLRKLCIIGCENIEEIIASDDENDASEIAFMKLDHLHLSNLPRLRSFCMGKHGFKFPLLDDLFVIDCPIMETFSQGVLNTPRLRKLHDKDEDEWHWNGDINSTIRKFVAKKYNQNSKDYCVSPQNLNEGSSN